MKAKSPEQQLIDMAEQETDPILKELLYGTVGKDGKRRVV